MASIGNNSSSCIDLKKRQKTFDESTAGGWKAWASGIHQTRAQSMSGHD